jgi:ABC-type amino acid transport substrate-binding protein
MNRLLGRLVLPLVAATVLTACASQYYAEPPKPTPPPAGPVLRVGVTPTYPPIIFKQGDQIVGVESELAALLGARLGRTAQLFEMPFTEQIDALLAGRTDIVMSGMSVTDARKLRVVFTEPYLEAGLMAAVRTADTGRYPSREAVLATNATVGVIEGTTGDVFVQRNFPNARRVAFSRASDGALGLRRHTVDVFVHDAPSIAWLVSANEAELAAIRQLLNREPLAWAVRPADTALLQQVNAALAGWKQDGTLAGILGRWLPYLNRAERAPAPLLGQQVQRPARRSRNGAKCRRSSVRTPRARRRSATAISEASVRPRS